MGNCSKGRWAISAFESSALSQIETPSRGASPGSITRIEGKMSTHLQLAEDSRCIPAGLEEGSPVRRRMRL